MLDWLKKRLGESKPFENTAGLDARSLELLAHDFAPLNELAANISTRVMRYLADGIGGEVLEELVHLTDAAGKLDLRCARRIPRYDGPTPRSEFFESVRCGSAEFFRRLGLVYEAVTRPAPRRLSRAFRDPKLDWLELLLKEAHNWPGPLRPCPTLTADMVEALIEREGFPGELLVQAVFQPNSPTIGDCELETVWEHLGGVSQSAVRHPQTVMAALSHEDVQQRIYAVKMLGKCDVPLSPFMERLVELALDARKQVRDEAQLVLADAKLEARPWIERKLAEGKNEEKVLAARLLWVFAGEAALPFLQSRLAKETNRKVLSAIEETLSGAVAASARENVFDLPPLAPIPARAPLGPETGRAWFECLEKANAAIERYIATPAAKRYASLPTPIPSEAVRHSFAAMQTGESQGAILGGLLEAGWQRESVEPVRQFWQRPELSLIHLVRFLMHVGALRPDEPHRGWLSRGYWLESLLPAFRRTHPETGLRELGAAFTTAGFDARRIGFSVLLTFGEIPAPLGFPPSLAWPYWAENLDLLEEAFAPTPGGFIASLYHRSARRNALHAAATLPHPPPSLVPHLWKLALGPKTERPLAQRALEALPDKIDRLIPSLESGDADTRFAAAEWLGRLGNARALDSLLSALKREKNEAVKGAMMSALELLGASVDQFLERKALLKEAEKGVAKGVPEGLAWFPFDRLPAVRWADNGQPVEPAILRWWLVLGFKLKNPEPGPALRMYAAGLTRSEREALGQFILEAWVGQDPAPISSKGILSVAAACSGAQAAPAVSRYLKQWHGLRVAQCRALLQMLAWVEHKTATQLLLAVGGRFRTKGIQEEAHRLAQALAAREGWSVAELADRAIPSAGLDDDGVLALDFGPRQFTARLNEHLEFVLADSTGKPLKTLPEPRKDDHKAKATEAKKIFSAAKKELKSVVAMQRDRLYEAVCTQRTWPFADWDVYLNRHPIARHHCQRLVWGVLREGGTVTLFRPLPDGSLTDAADDPVTVHPDDLVRVAHECQITPEQSRAWRQHFEDYKVEPLFEQFGRPHFHLPDERRDEDELTDFRGRIVKAFALRSRANQLGYTRGESRDGGWFHDYNKRFPTLGIQVVLEFSGSMLPEENDPVALTTLYFERVAAPGEAVLGAARIPLGEVPAVLVSECWNDLRQIAAEGPGFDPDWEKKTVR